MSVATSCLRCGSPLEAGDLLCAVCGALVPEEHAPEREREHLEILRCGTCGAAMRYDADERALECAFCGSLAEREELVDPPEPTEAFLPFRVTRAEAARALATWLGRAGFFRPSGLSRAARIESLRPLLWVAWCFDARALVSWTADSDAGAARADWAPHAGQVDLVFDDVLVPASRGLTRDETEALAPSYDLTSSAPSPGPSPSDAQVEAFDVQRSLARARVLAAIEDLAAARVERRCIPGKRFRNVRVALLLSGLDTRRLALPAWVLAYRYGDELFRVVISGQDAEVVTGRMPLSAWKILGVVLAAMLALALAARLLFGS